jgi:hypothetical protein
MLLLPDYSTMNKRGGEEKEHELFQTSNRNEVLCSLYSSTYVVEKVDWVSCNFDRHETSF